MAETITSHSTIFDVLGPTAVFNEYCPETREIKMNNALSLDAKLIAATNMAVAEAIWHTYYLQRGGTPAQTADQMVLRDIKQSVRELEKIAKKMLDEESDAALNIDTSKTIVPSEANGRVF
jgi:hypothetical protein